MRKKKIVALSILAVSLMFSVGLTGALQHNNTVTTATPAIEPGMVIPSSILKVESIANLSFLGHNNVTQRNVQAPKVIFTALSELSGSSTNMSLAEGQVMFYEFGNGFVMKVTGQQWFVAGVTGQDLNYATLWFHLKGDNSVYYISGENDYPSGVTSATGSLIGILPQAPNNVTTSLSTLLSFNGLYNTVSLLKIAEHSKTSRSALTTNEVTIPPGGGGSSTYDYTNTTTFTATSSGVEVTNDIISLNIEYDSGGVITGEISINAKYDVSFDSPFFSATESITDTLGFGWTVGLPASGSSTNSASYTHQNTQITYNIELEFGPYYRDYIIYEEEYYITMNMGTHINVPQLT